MGAHEQARSRRIRTGKLGSHIRERAAREAEGMALRVQPEAGELALHVRNRPLECLRRSVRVSLPLQRAHVAGQAGGIGAWDVHGDPCRESRVRPTVRTFDPLHFPSSRSLPWWTPLPLSCVVTRIPRS